MIDNNKQPAPVRKKGSDIGKNCIEMASSYSYRDLKIMDYFNHGYAYKEIQLLLLRNDDIHISLRQLKRELKRLGLCRRKSNCSLDDLYSALQVEINTSGASLGYRSMHQKLKTVYGIQTARKTVAELQKALDPDGVAARKARKFKRRMYYNKGPNFLWHLDGYDKLKPFGFCIHGCIDGYSRKLLWLECASTNNCPKVIGSYFLKYVESQRGTARVIRTDCGTENYNVAAMQRFFRSNDHDSMSGMKSFIFGKSTSNQKIEAYWSQLRRWFTQWWMNYFKDMRDDGSWDDSNVILRECLKFCFGVVIQRELDQIAATHNSYRIRSQRNQEIPNGRPNILYDVPEVTGGVDYKFTVAPTDIAQARSYVSEKSVFCCSHEFERLALAIMVQEDLSMPKTFLEARTLYDRLNAVIDNI